MAAALHRVPPVQALRLVTAALLLLPACSDRGPSSPGDFTDRLTFGRSTGNMTSELSGVSNEFRLESAGTVTVFCRIESRRDISEGGVVLDFEKVEANGSISMYRSLPFDPPRESRNVLVSSVILTDPATYLVTARTPSDPNGVIARDRLTILKR